MKRLVLGVVLVLAVVLITAGVVLGSSFVGLKEATAGAVVPGVELVRDGFVNVFLIDAGDGVVLVDCGSDPEAKAVLAALAARKLDASSVRAIFLTHGHRDHTGGCGVFAKAPVYAFEEERALIEGRVAAKGPVPRMMGADASKGRAVTNPLVDGTSVTVGGVEITPFLVPGHTAGSAMYLSKGVLFFGDAASGQSDGKIRAAPWIFSDDQAQCKASLEALAKRLSAAGLQVDKLAFAHSGGLDGVTALTSFH